MSRDYLSASDCESEANRLSKKYCSSDDRYIGFQGGSKINGQRYYFFVSGGEFGSGRRPLASGWSRKEALNELYKLDSTGELSRYFKTRY